MGKRQDLGNDFIRVDFNISARIYSAISRYARNNEMSKSSVVRLAMREWCENNGLIEKVR